jgi:hypothetical protein
MPILDEAAFDGHEVVRIFIAATVREGRRAEAALDARAIDYFVRTEVLGQTLLGLPRRFASFFVDAAQAGAAELALLYAGLDFGLVRDSDPSSES